MPTITDLDAAMAQPALSVPALRRLGGGSLRMNDHGRPLRAVGRDAVVYELRTPTGRILALRCLLRPDPRRDNALAERYVALGGDPRLERLRGADRVLPRDIRWIAEGVALSGAEIHRETTPIMAMERVPGRPLLHTVDRLCQQREQNHLALLADAWLATAALLEDAGFSHGDLAADNLIVRPDGSIALVDLDTAAWLSAPVPAIDGDGTPGYIHPRGSPHNPARRDRFPALIIWASLRVLERFPHLRDRWGDPPDRHGGALLWSADDLRQPTRSALFQAIAELADESLQPLLEIVLRAIRFAPDETPPLAEIAERLEGLGLPSIATATEHSRRRQQPSPSFAEWPAPNAPPPVVNDEFVPPAAPAAPPEPLATASAVAAPAPTPMRDERAAARQLAAALAARDTEMVTRLWQESAAIPGVAVQSPAVHRLLSEEAAAAIERAARRRDDEALVAAIAAAEQNGVAPSVNARRAARVARHRIAARASLGEAVARGDLGELSTLAYSGQLDCLDRMDATQIRVIERARAWPALERAIASDDDAAIVAAVDPALWRDTESLPPTAVERIDLAHRRLRWLGDVRTALRRRDGALLRRLLASAPPGTEQRLSEVESRRILRLSMHDAAVTRLERALREGPDREVMNALADLTAAGAPLPAVLDWTAIRGVADRITLADALRAAAAADPPDATRLARLLPAARAALGDQDAPDDIDWPALERSVLRAAHLARLREAIAANDDARIALAANPDPYDSLPLLTVEESARVRAVLERIPTRR